MTRFTPNLTPGYLADDPTAVLDLIAESCRWSRTFYFAVCD